MKHNYLFKALLTGLILATGSVTKAQCIHPINYDYTSGAFNNASSSYLSYVGERFEVTYPNVIAGDKQYSTTNDGSGATTAWGGFPGQGSVLPIVNDTLMNYPSDSCVIGGSISADMTGRVALLYRGSTYFYNKALAAQTAHALACVIVNNVSPGVINMGLPSGTTSILTIPLFMVTKIDGDAMNAQLHDSVPVTISVFEWGQGNINDLGFVTTGMAQWHNGAIPYYELAEGSNPMAYKGFDGAYVANFGSADLTNVSLVATTSFTPTGGSSSVVNIDSVTLPAFTSADSIWAMFCSSYNLEASISGTGKVDVNYYVNSYPTGGWIDQYPYDNSISYSFLVTDNIYCKGAWDAANNRPFTPSYNGVAATTGTSPTFYPYLWGPSYYISSGRYAKISMFSLYVYSTVGSGGVVHNIPTGNMYIYLFRWADTSVADGVMKNSELELQGIAVKSFSGGGGDTSYGMFTTNVFTADTNGVTAGAPMLQSNSWYWVAAEVEQTGSANGYLLGMDGKKNGFPRLYGRDTFDSYLEYYAPMWGAGDVKTSSSPTVTLEGDTTNYLNVVPFGQTWHLLRLDSTVYSNTPGLIPQVSLSTSLWPGPVETPIVTKVTEFKLFPNPASTAVNVTLGLENPAKEVTYKVLSATGRLVSTETRNNVQNETYTYNTEKLPNGNYFMVVIAADKPMFKKFTVLR